MANTTPNFRLKQDLTSDNVGQTMSDLANNFGIIDTEIQNRKNDLTTHKTAATLDHPDGSVTTAKLADKGVTTAKLADQAVTLPKIDPTLLTNVAGNQNNTFTPNSYSWVATANQQTFTLPANTMYTVGFLWVNVGGVDQTKDAIAATDGITFTVAEPLAAGTNVDARWYQGQLASQAHHTSHYATGADPIDVTQLQNYSSAVDSRIVTNTNQIGILSKTAIYVESFPKIAPEVNDTGRIQRAVDSVGRGTGTITRGAIIFSGYYEISSQIEVNQQAIAFFGNEDTVIKWTGNNTSSMFHLVDYSRVSFHLMTFLGNLNNPPTAAIYSDHSTAQTVGTNEYLLIDNCQFGRRFTADTTTGGSSDATPAGKLQRGVWFGGSISGDNDSFYINSSQIHNCSIAGVAIDNDQSIWGSLKDVVINDCTIGLLTGADIIGYNVSFNRCSTADLKVTRDAQVSIWGFNSEHSGRNIWSQSGGDVYIQGGTILINTEITSSYWAYLENGGDLVIRDLLAFEQGVSGTKLYANGGSLKNTNVYIRTSTLPNGSDGSGFEIHTNGLGALPFYVDIEHGDFVLKGKDIVNQMTYDPPSLSNGSQVVAQNTNNRANMGDFFIPSFNKDLQGILMTGNAYQTNGLSALFQNDTGGAIDLALGVLRWRKFDRKELKIIGSATYDTPYLNNGTGVTTTITVPGAQLGDFVVWASTSNFYTHTVTAYVSSPNTVSIRIQNETGGPSDLPSGTIYCAVVREVGDYIGAIMYDPASLTDGASVMTTLNIPGVKLGDFVLTSFSNDLSGVILTAYVSANDAVTVKFYNKTGGTIDLASGVLKVMTFRN